MILERPAPAARNPLHLIERPDDPPAPGELAVRVAACAVCRTDLQLSEGDLPARRLPIIPGHQAVGRVEAVGEGVGAWQVGDRVGIGWLAHACGRCAACARGRENLCVDARFTGWDRDGGFATRLMVDANFALRVPSGFSDAAAAPLLCGGIIGYRALKLSEILPGGRLGLFGFGASALLTLQVARHWGCEVYVCTRSRVEQLRARELGAIWAGGYDETPPAKLASAITFAPAGYVVVAALRALDRGGTLAINAIHLDRIPEMPYELLWWERTMRSVANYTRQDAREFLQLAEEIPLRTTFETHPLAEANVALTRLSRGEVKGAAVLVND